MPLVFAMNDETEADLEYEDIPYVSYEYPLRYRNLVQPGERFAYYRGRRRRGGGRQPQVYLGTGIVGQIKPSNRPDRLVCEVLIGAPFPEPIFFRTAEGDPLEPGGARRGYYQPGVRSIDDDTYINIVAAASGVAPRAADAGAVEPATLGGYADSVDAKEIEDYFRAAAIRNLRSRFPGIEIEELPRNHPGFDLRTTDSPVTYVEVKGTRAGVPTFFLSEGERLLGEREHGHWELICVYGIDLTLRRHAGVAIASGLSDLDLEVAQWRGRFRS